MQSEQRTLVRRRAAKVDLCEYMMSMASRGMAALLVAHPRRQGPPEVRLGRASVALKRALSPRARLLAQMQL